MVASSPQTASGLATPSQDELEDIILSARYGELEEIQEFVKKFGITALAESRDERGNGCLHMAAANGHKGRFTSYVGSNWPCCAQNADFRASLATPLCLFP